ncbi:MAG: ABC-F family ATP-binding cassette domain-containing protein [Anaerolineales bacterium]|nr:MAG: ABC-F family ATP-binding cassette domain-containing protein [Anaerolineales bacterium]
MLSANQISKSYGIETILDRVSFNLNSGEKVALLGPNGSGKTTLLRILAGLERSDAGSLTRDPPGLRIGYLPQGFSLSPDLDPSNENLGSYLFHIHGDPAELSARLEELAGALAAFPGSPELQRQYDQQLSGLTAAAESAGRAPQVLAALGLAHLPINTPLAHLSGGQKTRLALASVLFSVPELLLLDEPTNHLDIPMLEWLEEWLLAFRGAALIVSHDRAFLDRTVTGTLELDPVTHTVKAYPGNYTAYLEHKLAERERHWQAYKQQQDEIAHLQQAAAHVRGIARFKRGGKGDTGDKFAKGFFANRTKGTIARAKHLERRLEQLLHEERIEKPIQTWQMKLDFGETPASGRSVLELQELAAGYPGETLLAGVNCQVWYGARVALIGPNGSGKTTLLRTICGQLAPLAGTVRLGANIRLGYMTQEQAELDPDQDAYTSVRKLAPFSETEARAFLHQYLFSGDEVFLPIRNLSYGERARLSLACLVARGCNFLLLDEPINHLDIPSRARFEQAVAAYQGTVMAVVHDRYFMAGFASEIWEIEKENESAVGGLKIWAV